MKTLSLSTILGVLLVSIACGKADKSKGDRLLAGEQASPKAHSPEKEREVVLETPKVLEDLRMWWGDASKRASPSLLEGHPLSPFTQKILLETGLPKHTRVSIDFYSGERIEKHTFNLKEFLVIGSIHNRTQQIAISLDNEEIYALGAENGSVPIFVNSDLLTLLQFIRRYNLDVYISAKPREVRDYIELKDKYIAIDPKALDGEATWWNMFIQQHLAQLQDR